MFAVVANGIQSICKTQRQLDCIISIYPYPKFKKCNSVEEAREWLRQNARSINSFSHERYGETAIAGYARVEYFIDENCIFYNVDTAKAGYIKIQPSDDDVCVDSRSGLLKVKIHKVRLDNLLIAHHCIAIRRILRLLGDFIDVDIAVPDISVYLAMTKYSGKNYIIRGLQRDISNRLGGVSVTVRE